MQLVDGTIAGQNPFDLVGIARDQTLDGAPYPVLGQPAHFEQPGLQLFKLLLKMPPYAFCHQPNLPVT